MEARGNLTAKLLIPILYEVALNRPQVEAWGYTYKVMAELTLNRPQTEAWGYTYKAMAELTLNRPQTEAWGYTYKACLCRLKPGAFS